MSRLSVFLVATGFRMSVQFVDRRFEIVAADHTEQAALRIRDEGVAHLPAAPHVFEHLVGADARSEGGGPLLHDVLGRCVRVVPELVHSDTAEDNPLVVHDHTLVPLARTDELLDVGNGRVRAACRNVPASEVADYGDVGMLPLTREARRQPVGLSGDVLVNVGEPEALEPPRGSRAQVSLIVPAVGHDGSPAVEPRCPLPVQFLQRDVDRTRQVLLRILSLGKHFQDLSALGHQAPDLSPIDVLGHLSFLRGTCSQ